MMKIVNLAKLVFGAAVFLSSVANAAIIWDFREVGGDVVGTVSGSYSDSDVDILLGIRILGTRASISPLNGTIFAFDETSPSLPILSTKYEFGDDSSFESFGTGLGGNIGTYSGTPIALDFGTNSYYFTGVTAFSGTYTIENATFASIGITPGTYVRGTGNRAITLQFTPAAAVEASHPVSVWLFVIALGGIALRRYSSSRTA